MDTLGSVKKMIWSCILKSPLLGSHLCSVKCTHFKCPVLFWDHPCFILLHWQSACEVEDKLHLLLALLTVWYVLCVLLLAFVWNALLPACFSRFTSPPTRLLTPPLCSEVFVCNTVDQSICMIHFCATRTACLTLLLPFYEQPSFFSIFFFVHWVNIFPISLI